LDSTFDRLNRRSFAKKAAACLGSEASLLYAVVRNHLRRFRSESVRRAGRDMKREEDTRPGRDLAIRLLPEGLDKS
jgi:hypothetical protein